MVCFKVNFQANYTWFLINYTTHEVFSCVGLCCKFLCTIKDGSTNTLLSKLLLGSPCPWDITEDDVVDVGDFLILIAAWGASPS